MKQDGLKFKSIESEEIESKTQAKKQVEFLQKLGERLITLNKDQIKKIELNDKLLEAIILAQKITAHEAKRRQKQYIGKLMRGLEQQEIQSIIDYFDILDGSSIKDTQMLHFIENLRHKLIEKDDNLTEFLLDYPCTDIQNLRILIRNAREEKKYNKPPKAYREIFQVIKKAVLE